MNPCPPGGSSNCKDCPNEPSEIPHSVNHGHAQFPQHLQFSQPSYAMNIPLQHFTQPPLYPQNVHFVVVQPQYSSYSLAPQAPPTPSALVMTSMSASDSGAPHVKTSREEHDIVNLNNDENAEPERTARRLAWTEEEDERLIRAWLNNPGNKKYDVCWGSVAAAYNSSTTRDRRRQALQLKGHWQKITKKIHHFNNCWCQVKAKYPSSLSQNLQLMDKTWVMFKEEARVIYLEEAKHCFTLDHCWKALWDQPKWKAHISSLSSKGTNLSESGDYMSSSEYTEDVAAKEMGKQGSITASDSGTPHVDTGQEEQDIVNVHSDEDAEHEWTARRLSWTETEDIRLISAWLNKYRKKKYYKYWASVAAEYNSTTPRERRREAVQLKGHWQKIAAKIAHFNNCWCQVKAKYPIGLSDNLQLVDKTWAMFNEEAREIYREEAKHRFTLDHCWKAFWDQPKWRAHISSLSSKITKLTESRDYMSTWEDTEDVAEKEMGEQGCITAKEKPEGQGKMPSSSSEVEKDTEYSTDLQNTLKVNREELTGVQPLHSEQKPEFAILDQPETKDDEATISKKQTKFLANDASWLNEFHHSNELMAGATVFDDFQHGRTVREDVPEKGTLEHGCKVLRQTRTEVSKDVPGKEAGPQDCKTLEHERAMRDNVPERQTHTQVVMSGKLKRKRKGKALHCSSEVQEDIKRAMDLQTMLTKDRERMSEVQLCLSKDNLELARLKQQEAKDNIELARLRQQEAKDKRETTLYEKYSELLMADTSRFSEFQKAEYEKAMKRMGETLFGKDDS